MFDWHSHIHVLHYLSNGTEMKVLEIGMNKMNFVSLPKILFGNV